MHEPPFNANHALTIQLLEWIADRPHSYAEAMEVWRNSCPRLSIWEDALAAGLIDTDQSPAHHLLLTPMGSAMLMEHWRKAVRPSDLEAN